MKKKQKMLVALMIGCISFLLLPTTSLAAGTQENQEPIMMAYYRTWRDVTMPSDANSNLPDKNVTSMLDLPKELDIVSVFHYVKPGTDQQKYWDTLKNTYVPELHARGTKLVRTIDISELLKVPAQNGQKPTTADYEKYAEKLLATYVTPWNLDGLDVDMETNLTSDQIEVATGVFKALSTKLGPQSATGKLLIYDTNQTNHALFKKVAPYCDYLFLQAYGGSIARLDRTWESYKESITPQQFLPGISFPEEQDHNKWDDTIEPYETSRAYSYAMWSPKDGAKGGMFVYGVDRDGKTFGDDTISKTDFSWTKRLMKSMGKTVE